MRIFGILGVVACVAANPAMAQDVNFGDDNGEWANDGECDDPRFRGPGMTGTVLLDEDIKHDATDCRTAFEAGRITLVPAAGLPVFQTGTYYGDDTSQWANNGECDDRRFVGKGMTSILNNEDIGRDATDCRAGVEANSLQLWSAQLAQEATQCSAIDFGDDSGEFADDHECDDARFEGLGMASSVGPDNVGADASDCSRFCAAGVIALREY